MWLCEWHSSSLFYRVLRWKRERERERENDSCLRAFILAALPMVTETLTLPTGYVRAHVLRVGNTTLYITKIYTFKNMKPPKTSGDDVATEFWKKMKNSKELLQLFIRKRCLKFWFRKIDSIILARKREKTLFTFFGQLSSSLSPCLSQRFGCCTLRPSSGGWNVELNPLFRSLR